MTPGTLLRMGMVAQGRSVLLVLILLVLGLLLLVFVLVLVFVLILVVLLILVLIVHGCSLSPLCFTVDPGDESSGLRFIRIGYRTSMAQDTGFYSSNVLGEIQKNLSSLCAGNGGIRRNCACTGTAKNPQMI